MMLKKTITLFISLCILGTTFTQKTGNYVSFRNCLNEGNYWFYEQNYDSAQYYYEQAEQFELLFFPEEAHLFSRTLWEIGQEEKSVEVLLKAGKSNFFRNDTTYYLGMSPDLRNEVLKKLPEMSEEVPDERFERYDSLRKKDQFYRKKIKQSLDKDSIDLYYKLMNEQDSMNFMFLVNDIREHGYPDGYIDMGIGVTVILLHAGPSLLIRYYSVLHNEVENGRMKLYDFAIAYDRFLTTPETKNYQPYNCYFPQDSTEVISPEQVFINRCLIGMSPYYDMIHQKVYRRGMTPPKSKLHDYYKRRKETFNCIQIR